MSCLQELTYVIDKRITPRSWPTRRSIWRSASFSSASAAIALIGFTAATFAGRPEFGQFADAGSVATGIAKYVGATLGVLFALALIDASIIGAAALILIPNAPPR
jgi:Mn2+/Fe2+ NRAMP family transporter